MYNWLKQRAPLNLKTSITFVLQNVAVLATALTAALVVHGTLSPLFAYAVAGVAIAVSVRSAFVASKATGRRYAVTVERMEALAAGDLESPIEYMDHQDCVGRMSAAMHALKESAQAARQVETDVARQRLDTDREREMHEVERSQQSAHTDVAIASLATALAELADGNLSYRIEVPLTDATDRLRHDFNTSLDKLQQAMLAVGTNAQAIRSGAQEIATAADELSRRTEKQAANLQETAASLDSITVTVKKTADGAVSARQLVTAAKSDAETSGGVAQRAVDAMNGIASSSRQIGQIIGVIDEIAFQTNLLALNAGVEAARAGDAGRGFAVVASEVRTLAQRSAEAAKEIKALISNASLHVDQGVDLVNETGKALGRIVSHVGEINTVVTQITASAQEQATALQEVNTAVGQMDQMTQQNAAMVEESTAASHAMMQEVESLAGLLGRFRSGSGADVISLSRSAKPVRKPALEVVRAPKAASYGSAAAKPRASEQTDSWEEF